MLSDIANIARRDASLRGLATLLDPSRLGQRLGDGRPSVSIDELAIRYIRYKPARQCLVACTARMGGRFIDFYAKAVTPARWEKWAERHSRLAAGAAGLPLILPEEHVLIFPPSCDNRLHILPRLFDRASRKALIAQTLGRKAPAGELQLERLVHKPERRFVGRLHNASFTAAIKCYTPAGFAAVRRNAKAVLSGELFHVAEALGRSRRHAFMILPWIAGETLREKLWRHAAHAMDLERTGGAIAEFHAQSGKKLSLITPYHEALRVRSVGDDVGFLLPQLASRIAAAADWTASRLAEMPQHERPIHGDFYSKQVIIDDNVVGLLDLDEARLGDPLADLANFLAHVETYVLRGRVAPADAEDAREALLSGYRHEYGDVDPIRLRTRTVAALLRLLHAPFRNGEPDWPERIDATLQRTEQIVSELRRSPITRSRPAALHQTAGCSPVTSDAALAFASDAFKRETAERTLLAVLAARGVIGPLWRLRSANVLRHKPNRRCLIQYELQPARGENGGESLVCLGKVRAKGLDRAAYDLHRRLWKAGFDSGADVSVPEALGCVRDWHMWLQRRAPAPALDAQHLASGGSALGERIVDAIHRIHQADPPTRKRHTIIHELEILHSRLGHLAADRPDLASRLDRLLAGCERLAAGLAQPPMCGIHRDFYQDHVLADGQRLVLVDFDLYCLGDPAVDVGNFLGHLMELSIRTFAKADGFQPLETAMLDRFAQLRGDASWRRAQSYATLTLARHVEICRNFDQRRHTLSPLLDHCEQRLFRENHFVG